MSPHQYRVDEWLRRNAADRGERTALDDGRRRVTHSELLRLTDRVRESVRSVPTGAVIALSADSDVAGVAAFLGLVCSHAVVAPLNTRLTHAELQQYIERLGPAVIVSEQGHPAASLHGVSVPLARMLDGEALESFDSAPATDRVLPDEGAAVIFPTGGTTGLPKGALWSDAGLAAAIESSVDNLRVRAEDVELYISPLFHVTVVPGFLSTLAVGGSVLLQAQFDARQAAAALTDRGVTRMFGTPTAITRLLDELRRPLPGNELTLVYGAARSSERFRRRLRTLLPDADVYSGYGATEVGAVVRLKPEHQPGNRGVGRPVDGVRVSIIDHQRRSLPPGERGDVAVSSPWACVRYVGSDVDGPDRLDDGSIVMGDMGWLDQDGFLHLDGRRSEMIKSGGENVFPAEVESVLLAHPAVVDAAVFGVPDEVWGEQVRALAVVRPSAGVTPADLIAHCRATLAGYKTPKHVQLTDRLPMTANLKIDRAALVAIATEQSC